MRVSSNLTVCLTALLLAGCGNDKGEPTGMGAVVGGVAQVALAKVRGTQPTTAAAPASRAEIEAYGIPILRTVIKSRGADALVTIRDTKGDVVTWTTTDNTTFTLRDGVLLQTRGLGPDLMSAAVPPVADLARNGSTHQRSYFFLGEDDKTQRRDYTCTMTLVGAQTVEIFGRSHSTTHLKEDCVRAQGKITNDYWLEGETLRKSRQWVSPGTGFIEFERVVD